MKNSFEGLLLQDNPYFTAGFGLLGVGAGLAALRSGLQRSLLILQRRYMTTLEISSKDPSYPWILQWVTKRAVISGMHFSLHTQQARGDATTNAMPSFTLVPSPGVHYLRWQGSWIKVQRERERSTMLDLASGLPFETITFTMIGRHPQTLTRIIEESRADARSREEGKLILYTSFAAEWRPFGQPRRKRPLDSVILAGGLAGRLMADLREFLASGPWYLERGLPYRRGYLLHGPPGTGKSSLVQGIASELDYSICLLSLADGSLTDDRLNHLLNALPSRSILLLEDVDAAAIQGRWTADSTSANQIANRVTLSGLLNALDGVAAAEERIIFLTTNHPERLDPALVRPGRIDMILKIGLAEEVGQLEQMFSRFYPQHGHLAGPFAKRILDALPAGISPAKVQGHFIQRKSSGQEAFESVDSLLTNNLN